VSVTPADEGYEDGSHPELERLVDWTNRAESVLQEWAVHSIVETEKRAACFRALGRGWIFMQLSSAGSRSSIKKTVDNRTRFKWWFEGVERILRNRWSEFATMGLKDEDVDKWTMGYKPNVEIMFIMRGITTGRASMGVQRWNAKYCKEHNWASTPEIESEMQKDDLSEDERQAYADKVRRDREKAARKRAKAKARKKQASSEKEQEGNEGDGMTKAEREQGEQAQGEFENLLAELKGEVAEHAIS